MNITKKIEGYCTTYFYDGFKKYEHRKGSMGGEWWREYDSKGNVLHYKDNNGYEAWSEYDTDGNEIHYKNNKGNEYWNDDQPQNKFEVKEEEIKPFEFN